MKNILISVIAVLTLISCGNNSIPDGKETSKITCALNGNKLIETTDDTFVNAGRIAFGQKLMPNPILMI